MNKQQRQRVRKLAERFLTPEEIARIDQMPFRDMGYGFDQFGFERESALLAYIALSVPYERWFRVESYGHENIPASGPTLLSPNHSGTLPLDAAMIGIDLVKKMEKPRLMRTVTDNFMGFVPYLNTLLYRCGQVIGAKRNFEDLLGNGELVGVFPEGAKGTGKLYWNRYHLLKFNVGFIELSLLHRAAIVPTAVIGAEEQYPMFYDVKAIARILGLPYFPLTPFFPWLGPLGAIPLPSKYIIYYGEPLHFYRDYPPETVNEPEVVRMLADKVRIIIQTMVNAGLRKRKGILALQVEDEDVG
jgi:1-acyl-sn-glycerol-3-phosphate acyltransferase